MCECVVEIMLHFFEGDFQYLTKLTFLVQGWYGAEWISEERVNRDGTYIARFPINVFRTV